MRRAIFSILILGLITGCAGEAEKEATTLSLACEMSKCDCVSDVLAFFDTEPVQWKPDGKAYCPKGYHLRRLAPAPTNPI